MSLPLAEIDARVGALVPRKESRVVVLDGDGGALAWRAADSLSALGYQALFVLDGGSAAWRAIGYEAYTGTNVFSKLLGEEIERTCATPRLTPAELRHRLKQKDDVVILDSRPAEEFRRLRLADAINLPAAELPFRFAGLDLPADKTVIITCAGRTRGIIGAQALRNAGIANEVFVLENGTMGWLLDGGSLIYGGDDDPPAKSRSAGKFDGLNEAAQSERPQGRANLIDRFGVERIGLETLAAFAGDPDRSLYLFDVRSLDEYAAGHLPGSSSAPGTQLVMQVEDFIGTRNARVVLVDGPDGSRAAITASWLRQMGWAEPFVLPLPVVLFDEVNTVTETAAPPPSTDRWVSPYALPDEQQRRQGFEEYLRWSAGLLAQYDRDGTHRFIVQRFDGNAQ